MSAVTPSLSHTQTFYFNLAVLTYQRFVPSVKPLAAVAFWEPWLHTTDHKEVEMPQRRSDCFCWSWSRTASAAQSSRTKTVNANLEGERTTLEEVFTRDNDKFHTEKHSIGNRCRTAAKGWSYGKSGSVQIKHGNMQNQSVQKGGRASISSAWCETCEILIGMTNEG